MLTFVTFPPAPVDLKVDADTSLSAVLNYGQQQGLQFGTDLVSTYGPLGYLIFFYYHPNCAVVRMAVDVVLCFTVAAGLCLVAWHLGWARGGLLVGIFAFVAANLQPRTDLVLDMGFLCWGLLCWVESGRRLASAALVFTALAVFAALAKASMIFMAGLSVSLLAGGLVMRGNWRVGCGMASGFGLGIPLVWMAAGQRLSHLGSYLNNSLVLVRGYNEALGWEGLPQVILWASVLVLAALAMVMSRAMAAFGGSAPRPVSCRGLMLAWLCALLFLVWKHGVVRGDSYHVVYLFGFLSLLAVALGILPGEKGIMRLLARGLAAVCCVLPLIALQTWFFPSPSKSLFQPLRAFVYNAGCLLRPGDYRQRMGKVIDADKAEASLPRCRELIGHASVDVFGQNQVYGLWNGLNYHPRPVFQSYAACNAELMRLNEAFYRSDNAPPHVMFSLGPIDRKFPALEDALVLRDLLFRYKPAGSEGGFVVLKLDPAARVPGLKLLGQGTVHPGDRIDLSGYGGADLWLQIDLKPTPLGRLRQVLYQPATVRLAAWPEGPGSPLITRRAPPAMMQAGFVASPLLLDNDDLLHWYEGKARSRPGAYSIELLPEDRRFWQDEVGFRVCQIEPGKGP